MLLIEPSGLEWNLLIKTNDMKKYRLIIDTEVPEDNQDLIDAIEGCNENCDIDFNYVNCEDGSIYPITGEIKHLIPENKFSVYWFIDPRHTKYLEDFQEWYKNKKE